jgi:hypothetical protein
VLLGEKDVKVYNEPVIVEEACCSDFIYNWDTVYNSPTIVLLVTSAHVRGIMALNP